jgi:hypothetical protein
MKINHSFQINSLLKMISPTSWRTINNFNHSLFGDSENRENNYLKIRDLLSIALFNILGTHYLIHI